MEDKQAWEEPIVDDLGDAKDEIQHVSQNGAGDATFSILNPS